MIGGGTFSKEGHAKILNPLTSHWTRGSLFKSSSTDIGQMEKFVKHGTQCKGKRLKVIFLSTLLLEVNFVFPKKDEAVSHCQMYLVHVELLSFVPLILFLNVSATPEFSRIYFCQKILCAMFCLKIKV